MPSQASILFQTGYTSILKGFVDGQIYKNIFFLELLVQEPFFTKTRFQLLSIKKRLEHLIVLNLNHIISRSFCHVWCWRIVHQVNYVLRWMRCCHSSPTHLTLISKFQKSISIMKRCYLNQTNLDNSVIRRKHINLIALNI